MYVRLYSYMSDLSWEWTTTAPGSYTIFNFRFSTRSAQSISSPKLTEPNGSSFQTRLSMAEQTLSKLQKRYFSIGGKLSYQSKHLIALTLRSRPAVSHALRLRFVITSAVGCGSCRA